MREAANEHQLSAPGAGTNGLAWQGASLWSVEGVGPIHKINPETGEVELTLTPEFPGGAGIEWDGEYLWYNSIWQQTFYKLRVPELEIVTTFPSPAEGPHGLAWDGEHLWSVDMNTSRFIKQCPETGEILAELKTPGGRAHGLAWDGEALWNADTNDHVIYRIHPETGEVLDSVSCPNEPHGLTWDGTALWYGEDKAKKSIASAYPDNSLRIFIVNPENIFTPPGRRGLSPRLLKCKVNYGFYYNLTVSALETVKVRCPRPYNELILKFKIGIAIAPIHTG